MKRQTLLLLAAPPTLLVALFVLSRAVKPAQAAAPAAEAFVPQDAAPLALPSFSDDGFPVAAELLVEVAHAMKHEADIVP